MLEFSNNKLEIPKVILSNIFFYKIFITSFVNEFIIIYYTMNK